MAWLVFPEARRIVAITPEGESRHQRGEPCPVALPDLEPAVDELFWQIGPHDEVTGDAPPRAAQNGRIRNTLPVGFSTNTRR
jgi:hypothetical protein